MKRIFTSGSMGTQVGSLLVYTGISGPAHPPKEKYSLKPVIVACVEQATITADRIFHFGRHTSTPAHPPKEKYSLKPVIVACVEQATITALRQNISLWEGVLVIDLVYLLDSRRQQQL